MGEPAKVEFYPDARGEWRWRVRANNGKIVADSSEGYGNKDDAEKGYVLTMNSLGSLRFHKERR